MLKYILCKGITYEKFKKQYIMCDMGAVCVPLRIIIVVIHYLGQILGSKFKRNCSGEGFTHLIT